MFSWLAIPIGAIARRLRGSGKKPRWLVPVLSAIGGGVAMYPHGLYPALLCAAVMPLAWGIPKHGESIQNPVLMSLRNVAFTAALAFVLDLVFAIDSSHYAPIGALAGVIYWAAKKWAPGDWNAYAEIGLGALLVGGLTLI